MLVFLHEGLGSIAQWKDFPAILCQCLGLPGLVYERRGHGGSDSLAGPRPLDYHYHEAQVILPQVLAACAVDDCILIGHSDGGTIALLYAAAFPERPRALITEAAHVFVEELTLTGIRATREAFRVTDLAVRLARYHGTKTPATFAGWAETWLAPEFRNWNIEHELPRIRCPALILQGEADEYGTPEQVHAIARGVSGSVRTLLIPDCGHVPHFQARDTVSKAMTEFIEAYRA